MLEQTPINQERRVRAVTLPLPLTKDNLALVRDYTPQEWEDVKQYRNQLLLEKDGKCFMTPKPGVEILASDQFLDHNRYLMLSWQLSKLPDGCWFQECPDKLPGVPMTDVAIRVRVNIQDPIAVKMRRMSSNEFEIAKKQLTE